MEVSITELSARNWLESAIQTVQRTMQNEWLSHISFMEKEKVELLLSVLKDSKLESKLEDLDANISKVRKHMDNIETKTKASRDKILEKLLHFAVTLQEISKVERISNLCTDSIDLLLMQVKFHIIPIVYS